MHDFAGKTLAACIVYPYIGLQAMVWLCFVLVIGLRFGALRFGWHLFHPRPGRWRMRPWAYLAIIVYDDGEGPSCPRCQPATGRMVRSMS